MVEGFSSAPAEVVVGIDGTAAALRAVAWAATEARLRDQLLRVVLAPPRAESGATGDAAHRHAAGLLARAYARAHRREPLVEAAVSRADGQPLAALAQASRSAALLVLGVPGDGLGAMPGDGPLRSVAAAVVAEAHCPVSVVRGRSHDDDGPVVLGLRDVTAEGAAVELAFADAARHGSSLVALHVAQPGLYGRRAGLLPAVRSALRDQLAPWCARYPRVPVEVRVEGGATVDAILAAAASARHVVVSTRGHAAGVWIGLGSTGRSLLRLSPCPVTVVPQGVHPRTPGVVTSHRSDPADR